MYHLKIRHVLTLNIFVLFLSSCEFIDLRPINIKINPDIPNSVLPDYKTPVSVSFDTEMDRKSVEQIFSVVYSKGKVQGDLKWYNNTLLFFPAAGWIPGVRYYLSITGSVISANGREYNQTITMPFFAVNNNPSPYIIDYFPKEGASVGVSRESGGNLHLVFSKPMEVYSTQDAVTIDGFNSKEYEWNEAKTELEIFSNEPLNAWAACRWTVSDKAFSTDGVPLDKQVSGSFFTNIDSITPTVEKVFQMIRIEKADVGYTWIKTGLNIDEAGLGANQAIGVQFSKPMDNKTVLNCMQFEPSLTGITEQIQNNLIIFTPNKFPETGTTYRLKISGDTKDTFGLKINSDYVVYFQSDIPYLDVIQMSLIGVNNIQINQSEVQGNISKKIKISKATGELKLILDFSLPIENVTTRSEIVSLIKLDTFFPNGLSPIAMLNADWLSSTKLLLEWNGLSAGTDAEPHYYKLYVSGGTTGISNDNGSYLKENINLYLEAEAE
ncbi:hypothetical protein FACS189494_11270 [Spirochaetia bacterium]|nr:hypothetical protein FACS189494_11270 [Spirochaetia bacterium]